MPKMSPISHITEEEILPYLPKKRGEINIIAASPGAGKSTAMYAVIARKITDAFTEEKPLHILWAAHGIHGEKSLGKEALQKLKNQLNTLPIQIGIIQGRRKFGKAKDYFAQFIPPKNVAVHIISHAHLPYLLSEKKANYMVGFMQSVDLIVIDEDPLFSFIKSSGIREGLSLKSLESDISPAVVDSLEQALCQVMLDIKNGTIPGEKFIRVENIIKGIAQLSLTGKAFWEELSKAAKGHGLNFNHFSDTLTRLVFKEQQYISETVVGEFQSDWVRYKDESLASNRFGIICDEGKSETIEFRYDFLKTISADTPPMVILDAYAEEESKQYQQVFPAHQVNFFELGERLPLEIEVDETLHIDKHNFTKNRQEKRKEHLVNFVKSLNSKHTKGTLILSFQDIILYLERKIFNLPQDKVKLAYWFAGRGVNSYQGCHVVALHAPERPAFFQHHTLSALAPYDSGKRKKLAEHLRNTELLQMLHRGRQTTYSLNDIKRPRVIIAFKPPPFLDSRWARIIEREKFKEFRRTSTNPYHTGALQTIAAELYTLLGAVPHSCLVALGLYTSDTEIVNREANYMLPALKRLTRNVKKKAASLDGWHKAGGKLDENFKYFGFNPVDDNNRGRILGIINSGDDKLSLEKYKVKTKAKWGAHYTIVYAESQAAAEKAIRLLGGL